MYLNTIQNVKPRWSLTREQSTEGLDFQSYELVVITKLLYISVQNIINEYRSFDVMDRTLWLLLIGKVVAYERWLYCRRKFDYNFNKIW